jgi:primosomal protein N' (replication factor Y) (superfamily II helicase)
MNSLIKIARILVDLSLNQHFDYAVPKHLLDKVDIGTYVNVPFGRGNKRVIRGCVIDFPKKSPYKNLKEIIDLYEHNLTLPKALIKLGEWMAEYYCCSREQALRALLPGAVRSGRVSKKSILYVFLPDPKKATEYLFSKCQKSEARKSVIQVLLQKPDLPLSLLLKMANVSAGVIDTLVKHQIVIKEKRHIERDPFDFETVKQTETLKLTDEQKYAVDKINSMMLKGKDQRQEAIDGRQKIKAQNLSAKALASANPASEKKRKVAALLYGVTGSGKTEVYLRVIKECIKIGRETIVLVPEISLTPQTTERFRNRFGDEVSVLHSGLSDGERFDEWMKIYEGRVKIVVGARSALFAPFRNLGLIIVDEEHENSYKQDESPRYHARDVAVMRAFQEGAVAVLGSATPSIESFYNAQKEKYELITISKRVEDLVMPKVNIVDMSIEAVANGGGLFSKQLKEAIYKRIDNGEQTILFLNRRGFATYLSCPHCNEYVATCPDCSISYTYHKSKGCLACHICGSVVPAPTICPKCNSPEIRYSGTGTEKIEDITAKLFPYARIVRMDSDTMVNRKSYETTLTAFRKGDIDILIGTQMIAKGLDFPNVTLVGVINADTALNLPDFRASERTFQLLTQVAGRAGRGILPGEVYIQTHSPFNSAIQFAVNHDYSSFYEEEIEIREQLQYPPVGHLAVIKLSGEDEELLVNIAEKFSAELNKILSEDKTMVSPPCPAPISKIKNKYRYSIMFRGIIPKGLKKYLKSLVFGKYRTKGINIQIDIDAVNLM